MQRFLMIAVAAGLAVGMSGCVIHVGRDDDAGYVSRDSVEKQEVRNRDAISRIAMGTPVDTVLAQMGEPDFSDLTMIGNKEVRVLRYRTHRMHSDGDTTRDETTPLVFVDGKLSGVGDLAAAQALAK